MSAAPAECEGCGAVHGRSSMAQWGFPQFQWVDQKIFPGSEAGRQPLNNIARYYS